MILMSHFSARGGFEGRRLSLRRGPALKQKFIHLDRYLLSKMKQFYENGDSQFELETSIKSVLSPSSFPVLW